MTQGKGGKLLKLSLVLNDLCTDSKFFATERADSRPQARPLLPADIRCVLPYVMGGTGGALRRWGTGQSAKGHSAPEVYVPHHAVPHSIGTEEEEDEQGAAGGSLDAGEAAARRAVPHGQPDMLLEETSLQLCYEDPGEAPQLCLT